MTKYSNICPSKSMPHTFLSLIKTSLGHFILTSLKLYASSSFATSIAVINDKAPYFLSKAGFLIKKENIRFSPLLLDQTLSFLPLPLL